MEREECPEQLRLLDQYSRAITSYSDCREALRHAPAGPDARILMALEKAWDASQAAWESLERHIANHHCVGMVAAGTILDKAVAAAALEIILVADDQRLLVAVNDAAVAMFGVPREEVLGRAIDEFFLLSHDVSIPDAWERFVAEGTRWGICELLSPGVKRRFEYRAKANFEQGLHLSVLREIGADEQPAESMR